MVAHINGKHQRRASTLMLYYLKNKYKLTHISRSQEESKYYQLQTHGQSDPLK